jgi:hypothetical protein
MMREIIGDGTKALREFDDGLFEALVEKVVIKENGEFEFWFEGGTLPKIRI